MRLQLSPGKKGFIYILCCVVVLAAILFCLLLPGLARLESVKGDRAEAEAQKIKTQTVIKNKAANEAVLAELASQAVDKTSAYYAPMEEEDADALVSGMVSRYGFTPISLNIEALAEASVSPYYPQGLTDEGTDAQSDAEEQQNQASKKGTGENNSEDEYEPVLNSYRLTVNAKGTSNQVAGLVAEICLNPSMHLISFDNEMVITEENVYDTNGVLTSTNTVVSYEITVTLELFTYESYEPQSEQGEESAGHGGGSLDRDGDSFDFETSQPGTDDTTSDDDSTDSGSDNNSGNIIGNTPGGSNTTEEQGNDNTGTGNTGGSRNIGDDPQV